MLCCVSESNAIHLCFVQPCTISVAATHQLLTEILLYTMKKVQIEGLDSVAGGRYSMEDVKVGTPNYKQADQGRAKTDKL